MPNDVEEAELQNGAESEKEGTSTHEPNESIETEKVQERTEPAEKRRKGGFTLYKFENDKLTRLRPTCERCGPGYFMADHGNRYTCGHCGFTWYKPSEK